MFNFLARFDEIAGGYSVTDDTSVPNFKVLFGSWWVLAVP